MLQSIMIIFNVLATITLLLTLTSCINKKNTLVKKTEIKKESYYRLKPLMTNIEKQCQLPIRKYKEYLIININQDKNFFNKSIILTNAPKKQLDCFTSFVKQQDNILLQINIHSNKNKKLSDKRAITVAELLFNKGVRHEIYAKGCKNTKLKDTIKIYIYSDKKYFKNRCH